MADEFGGRASIPANDPTTKCRRSINDYESSRGQGKTINSLRELLKDESHLGGSQKVAFLVRRINP